MPPQLLFDITGIDLNNVVFDQEAIRACNPQRGDMEQLNAIVYANPELHQLLGVRYIGENEFWVSGHIPGRPLFPGVLMIEAGAQLASFYTRKFIGWQGFIGFGGVEECKFRSTVPPNSTLYLLGQRIWQRHRRIGCKIQGLVNGTLCFETTIVGVEF